MPEREFFIDSLLVRIHFIIVMIGWTGLAPWEFESPFFMPHGASARFRAKRGQRKSFQGLSPEIESRNLALTVLYVPDSLDSGLRRVV